jgi:hypothetical protein
MALYAWQEGAAALLDHSDHDRPCVLLLQTARNVVGKSYLANHRQRCCCACALDKDVREVWLSEDALLDGPVEGDSWKTQLNLLLRVARHGRLRIVVCLLPDSPLTQHAELDDRMVICDGQAYMWPLY